MFEKIDELFTGYETLMKRMKKAGYEKDMVVFSSNYEMLFKEMLITVAGEEDKERAADDIGRILVDRVYALYEKRGKVKNARKTDLSFYMICYVFPAILLTKDENATLLCDKIRDNWNSKFEMNIEYTDYDSIYSGFRDKIFGIF